MVIPHWSWVIDSQAPRSGRNFRDHLVQPHHFDRWGWGGLKKLSHLSKTIELITGHGSRGLPSPVGCWVKIWESTGPLICLQVHFPLNFPIWLHGFCFVLFCFNVFMEWALGQGKGSLAFLTLSLISLGNKTYSPVFVYKRESGMPALPPKQGCHGIRWGNKGESTLKERPNGPL